jgi:hypothetical protein
MSAAKLALVAGLVAIALSACGATTKPEAGTLKAASVTRKGVTDPRTTHVKCLQSEHVPVTEFSRTWLQIGTKPSGPTVHFEPTPGAAQDLQIDGQVQSAEVIGAALLYPNQASDTLLQKVEDCMAKGVTG